MRLTALLLVLLLVSVTHAQDGDGDGDDEPTGLSTRLHGIDDTAELEANHPERAGEEPAEVEEQPEDPTAVPAEEAEPADAPAGARRTTSAAPRRSDAPSALPAPLAPSGGSTLESPIRISPLAAPHDADDDS